MVLLLVFNVLKHPRQVALAETDHPISALPADSPRAQRLIGVMRAASLEIFYPLRTIPSHVGSFRGDMGPLLAFAPSGGRAHLSCIAAYGFINRRLAYASARRNERKK